MSRIAAQLRDKQVLELQGNLVELKSSLAKEKSLSISGTKAQKPSNIRKIRRDIARINTIIMEKQGVSKNNG